MKYTKEQLKHMAEQWVKARANGDIRYLEVVRWCSVMSGLTSDQVISKIEELANA